MRWKTLRRRLRLGHSGRVTIGNQTPWPLRLVTGALVFGTLGAAGMWGWLHHAANGPVAVRAEEIARLKEEIAQLRNDRDRAQSISNTADSLLKAEKSAQDKLAEQVHALEAENLAIKGDLGFFERLLPSEGGAGGLSVRGLQVEVPEQGEVRYQLLVMQPGMTLPEFHGRFDLTLSGSLDGKPWNVAMPGGPRTLHFKQYQRVEGMFQIPPRAVVKSAQVRVTDAGGHPQATQSVQL